MTTKREVLSKPTASSKAPTISKTLQNKTGNNTTDKNNNATTKVSKSVAINTNQTAKNGRLDNNASKSLPSGQIQNVIRPGQQNKGQNNQQAKGSVQNNIPSKGNKPQPDGQVIKTQTLQPKELPQKGKQLKSTDNAKQTAQKQPVQVTNGNKTQQNGQKPVINNAKVQQPGPTSGIKQNIPQKPVMNNAKVQQPGQTSNIKQNIPQKAQQTDTKQTNTQSMQKSGVRQSLQQKDSVPQTGQKLKKDKPEEIYNNGTKSKPPIQKYENQKPGVVQRPLQNGQKPDNQSPGKSKNSQQSNSQKGDSQKQNLANNPQQNGKNAAQIMNVEKNKRNDPNSNQLNNRQTGQNSIQKLQSSKVDVKAVQGQKSSQQNNVSKPSIPSNKNGKNASVDKVPMGKPGMKQQNGKQDINNNQGKVNKNISTAKSGDQNPSRGQNGVTKKKKKKEIERRRPPERPQIIEYPAGVTSVSLTEAQVLLEEINELRGDKQYEALADFLNQLFQKVQNLETGNYSRTEVEFFVRQFQDFNEGFHYRMESNPRGHALLLTNTKFYKVPGDPWSYVFDDRPGGEIDADNLEKLLTDMGYLVTRRDNIKHWEMKWELKCMADMDHKKFDSFICVISSHGNLNQVYGCDGLRMILSKQIRQFRSENCPSLAGKPKMFFLQSCQTDEGDQTLRTESTAPTDPNNKPKPGELERSKFLINDVDFLVGYSTLPGNHSYRYENTGSWYLNALHTNLKDNFTKYDIVSILEDVNYDVSRKREEYNYLDSYQVSMFSSTLRGPLFFH